MAIERHRALVVDDEAAIRKLIVRALRKEEFECDEAADGEFAARLAAKSRYDIVIADLKMPNKNGHALALEILQQEDRPLIIVHTGVIEPRLAKDLMLRGVDDIVFKPTDFDVLAAKAAAMVERRSRAHHEGTDTVRHNQHVAAPRRISEELTESPISLSELNAKLADLATVLPVSNSALDVYEMSHSHDWELSQIAAAIQRDASLAAEVLRLANSSLYNQGGRRIVTLDEAILRIGENRVAELALAANALIALTPNMVPWMNLELAWKRSMAAGIAAESLVELGGHQEIEEGLLLSAIMYPLGRVALGMLFPKHYQSMVERCLQTGESLREQERRVFPTSHTEVMAHVLASWRIPSDVFLPLKFCLDDFSTLARLSEPTRTRTELVKVAILLGRLAVDRWETWDLVQLPAPRVLQRLRVHDVRQIVQQTRLDLSKLAEFHPGRARTEQQVAQPAELGVIAYCNLSGNEPDLFVDLLSSMGYQPTARTIDEIRRREEIAIVNCLGAPSEGFATGGWSKALFVTDQEYRDAFARFGRGFALPNSYGRFREALDCAES